MKGCIEVFIKWNRCGPVGYVEEIEVDGKKMEVPPGMSEYPTLSYFGAKEDVTWYGEKRFYTSEQFKHTFPDFHLNLDKNKV